MYPTFLKQVLRRGVRRTRWLHRGEGAYRCVGGGEGVARVRLLGGRGRRGERVRPRRRQGLGKRSLLNFSLIIIIFIALSSIAVVTV